MSSPRFLHRLFCLSALVWCAQAMAALEIDWQRFFAGTQGDVTVEAVAVAPNGDIYVTGSTQTADLPGATGQTLSSARDVFLARFDAKGTILKTVLFGGDNDLVPEGGRALVIDPTAGDVFVTGAITRAFLGGVTGIPSSLTSQGQQCSATLSDVFVAGFDSVLNPIYFSCFGSDQVNETGDAIAIDPKTDTLYVAGTTHLGPTDSFPNTTNNAWQQATSNLLPMADVFIIGLALPVNGLATMRYASLFGGGRDDVPHGLVVGPNGHLYLVGETVSDDLPVTADALQSTHVSNQIEHDAFIAELSIQPDRTDLVYLSYLGGQDAGGSPAEDSAQSVAVGPQGKLFVVGTTASADLPSTDGSSLAGGQDAFVLVLAPDLARTLSTLRYIGGDGLDAGRDIVLGQDGRPLLSGLSDSADLGGRRALGGDDLFLARLDAAGGLVQTLRLGGQGKESGASIALLANGEPVLSGSTAPVTNPSPTPSPGPQAGMLVAFRTATQTSSGTATGGGGSSSSGSGGQTTQVGDGASSVVTGGGGGGACLTLLIMLLFVPNRYGSGRILRLYGLTPSRHDPMSSPTGPVAVSRWPGTRGGEC